MVKANSTPRNLHIRYDKMYRVNQAGFLGFDERNVGGRSQTRAELRNYQKAIASPARSAIIVSSTSRNVRHQGKIDLQLYDIFRFQEFDDRHS